MRSALRLQIQSENADFGVLWHHDTLSTGFSLLDLGAWFVPKQLEFARGEPGERVRVNGEAWSRKIRIVRDENHVRTRVDIGVDIGRHLFLERPGVSL